MANIECPFCQTVLAIPPGSPVVRCGSCSNIVQVPAAPTAIPVGRANPPLATAVLKYVVACPACETNLPMPPPRYSAVTCPGCTLVVDVTKCLRRKRLPRSAWASGPSPLPMVAQQPEADPATTMGLPPGYERKVSVAEGRVYYVCHLDKTTSWEPPSGTETDPDMEAAIHASLLADAAAAAPAPAPAPAFESGDTGAGGDDDDEDEDGEELGDLTVAQGTSIPPLAPPPSSGNAGAQRGSGGAAPPATYAAPGSGPAVIGTSATTADGQPARGNLVDLSSTDSDSELSDGLTIN